ncbi:hypothetical protein OZI60_26650, partial [Escherichia coli]|uniref:hypothetical protein n=1 Tax=Escherichia coli TaxID=562 RepID=UPI002284FF87
WKGWAILLRQKQKKLIMLPSETMIWQPEFTDKTLSRKPGAVQTPQSIKCVFLCFKPPGMAVFFCAQKKPFDLLKHPAVWQLQVSDKKSKGRGGYGDAHPMEL